MESLLPSSQAFNFIVVGGGPAGFMAAITAAEAGVSSILVLEATSKLLEKVRISGGGRCNVTNNCLDPRELIDNYPRGRLPLRSSFSRFSSGDSIDWFSERGLTLVSESDGRMFPKTNTSSAVINCLRDRAKACGVQVFIKAAVHSINHFGSSGFHVYCKDGRGFVGKKVLLATGSHPSGCALAASLGHDIVKQVPSLFSLRIEEPFLNSCSGIAIDDVSLVLISNGTSYRQNGRVLITHWGLSGPVVLRLTAFAARSLYLDFYKTELKVNWVRGLTQGDVLRSFIDTRKIYGGKIIMKAKPFRYIPNNVWIALLSQAKVNMHTRWADCSKKSLQKIAQTLTNSRYIVKGKGPFGEEFVTAGGVDVTQIDFKSMESKLCKGLYFAGELIDVDGVTGGFNFQHCWTTGWLAGNSIANK